MGGGAQTAGGTGCTNAAAGQGTLGQNLSVLIESEGGPGIPEGDAKPPRVPVTDTAQLILEEPTRPNQILEWNHRELNRRTHGVNTQHINIGRSLSLLRRLEFESVAVPT